jgi:predicted dehydrogenase
MVAKHNKIKVGIVGGSVNPESWAIKSHLPALINHDDYELIAVSTSNQESAINAKRILNIKYGYVNYDALIQNKEIDLVVVSVKAPLHYEIIKESIKNQKHVYSEWPLTNNINQAKELTNMALNANIHHVIGLQSRQSSILNQAKNIIKDGKLGAIFSVNMQVATQGKGKFTTNRTAYQFDPNNGATLLDINGGHALDLLTFLLGDLNTIRVSSNDSFKNIYNVETNENDIQLTPNVWEIIGKINDTVSVNVSILVKSSQDYTFRKVVVENENESLQGYFKSIYDKLSQDIKNCTHSLPDFSEGLKLQLLLQQIKAIQNK